VPRVPLDVDLLAALDRRIAREDAAIGRFVAPRGLQVVPVGYAALVGARVRP
jgi:hypothetical protein